MIKAISIIFSVVFSLMACVPVVASGQTIGPTMMFGGDDREPPEEICPEGTKTVSIFLQAMQKKDYPVMYELIDDSSKEGYSLDEAKFDFQFMEVKEYRISSARKKGDDFEFILASGDWKDGDKDIKKMIIDGRTFKVIMPRKGTFFKDSM
ncbi:MAG: hypothetical protein P9L88_00385 [Candidatus Tantalella remota]|nr:hypothetical protein [Candidatus Tantalella remota]